jgi:hypothetical protein
MQVASEHSPTLYPKPQPPAECHVPSQDTGPTMCHPPTCHGVDQPCQKPSSCAMEDELLGLLSWVWALGLHFSHSGGSHQSISETSKGHGRTRSHLALCSLGCWVEVGECQALAMVPEVGLWSVT